MELDADDIEILKDQNKIDSEEDIGDFADFETYFGFDDVDDDGELKELFF